VYCLSILKEAGGSCVETLRKNKRESEELRKPFCIACSYQKEMATNWNFLPLT
jgi:hypothetical protein